uniref:Reverse transcriptase domain-containing protein n=1 Tax=Octopus bimaculoides TaxID=37653 RepID=A0A0L8FPS1_OCTBM
MTKLIDAFAIPTSVRQGCLVPPMIFLFATDWVKNEITSRSETGIRWTAMKRLEDICYADDIGLQ